MAGHDCDGSFGFHTLFTKNVPHILEIIFFSMDYESYKTSLEVSTAWKRLLTSEAYKRNAKSVFAEDIMKDEKELWFAAREGPSGRGNSYNIERIFSTGLVNVNSQHGKNNTTALYMAVVLGHKDIAQVLIERGADPNKGTNSWGQNSLLEAVKSGQNAVANMLIDAGADPNIADMEKHTPLRCASGRGNVELVKLLLDKGADPNKTEPHRADKPWKYPGSTALMCAVFNGHKDVVRLLLGKGAKPNVREGTTQGYTGCTPLHFAATFGYKEIAQMLLDAGANINRTDKDGRTPLKCATEKGHQDVGQLLLDRGAKGKTHKTIYVKRR